MKHAIFTLSVSIFVLAHIGATHPNITLKTTFGDIELRLAVNDAPQHSRNFFLLSWLGFYDGLTFHRLVPGFVIQGGDPAGNGTGGPGYTIPAEIGLPHEEGALAAARTADQVNPRRESSGSQFYITVAPTPRLDGAYSVYGKTVRGMEVVKKIVEQPRDRMDKPLTPILIQTASVGPQTTRECNGWKLASGDSGVSLTRDNLTVPITPAKARSALLFCEPVLNNKSDVAVVWVLSEANEATITIQRPGAPDNLWTSEPYKWAYKPAMWDLDDDGVKEILFLQERSLPGKTADAIGKTLILPVALCAREGRVTECTSQFKPLALAFRGLGIKMLATGAGKSQELMRGAALVWIANQWLGTPETTARLVGTFCQTCIKDLEPHEPALKPLLKHR